MLRGLWQKAHYVRPSVMQCVLAVRETVVIKLSRWNIVAQGLSNSLPPFPSLALIHTSLSVALWPGCRQAVWRSPLREKREVAQHLHFTHTIHVRQAWWCRATLHLSHSWGCALGQLVRQASALVREGGTCHLVKERKTVQNFAW